jgi:hypothetical protein
MYVVCTNTHRIGIRVHRAGESSAVSMPRSMTNVENRIILSGAASCAEYDIKLNMTYIKSEYYCSDFRSNMRNFSFRSSNMTG